MNVSIRSRLLISAFIILVAFLGLTGVALNKGFHDSVETAVKDRLQAHLYAMLAAAELTESNNLYLPQELPEPRFSAPDSGLVASVTDSKQQLIWKSKSMLGISLPVPDHVDAGQWMFEQVENGAGRRYLAANFVASWAGTDRNLYRFRFQVAEDYRLIEKQVAQFRRSLWTWLGAAGLFLLAAQGSILRWSLSPLNQAEAEIAAIESGHRKRLSAGYPKELSGLTQRLNVLVENSEKHLQRYRDSLGNLAHSLKTPLAVLRNALDSNASPETLRSTTDEQFRRMVEIIDHQLQRAATAGRSVLSKPLAVSEPIYKITNALQKVYAQKSVTFKLNDSNAATFVGDEGDFYELAGNLLDNAFKWCRTRVNVSTENITLEGTRRLKLVVDDDGPGIPENLRDQVLQRGRRADAGTEGHGLGLDMVVETVNIYNGGLDLKENDWGGSRIEVIL